MPTSGDFEPCVVAPAPTATPVDVVTTRLDPRLSEQLAEITVKLHRGNVMRKMDAKSVADLVRMADMIGIAGKS